MAILGGNFIRRTAGTGFFPAIDIRNSTGLRIGALCRAHITFSITQFFGGPVFYYNVAADPNATSFNISIIEQLGVGLYAIRFTHFMPHSDYTAVFNAQHSRASQNGNRIFFHLRGKSPGEIILETVGGSGEVGNVNGFDVQDADLMIFTDAAQS